MVKNPLRSELEKRVRDLLKIMEQNLDEHVERPYSEARLEVLYEVLLQA